MLPSFEILNFRTFRHLRIERLARVNLIVGKNGVGKTTLLEALWFYGMGNPLALRECLAGHDEWGASGVTGDAILDLRALFHGRDVNPPVIDIGPLLDENSRLRIRLIDIERVEESDGSYHYEEAEEEAGTGAGGEILKGVVLERKKRRLLISPDVSRRRQLRGKYVGPAFVPAGGVQEADLTYWWDSIALTRSEQQVIEVLSLLAPVDGLTTTEDPTEHGARIFKARLRGESAPVPLRSLGGGLVRLFQVAVALEYSYLADKDRGPSLLDERGETPWHERVRLLLVDEIENGIHYTAHADLWRAVFRIARQNDVQVFATSHSLDCLKGFNQAVAQSEENDGLVIRLERIPGEEQTGAVVIDREDLPIVVRDLIEVR